MKKIFFVLVFLFLSLGFATSVLAHATPVEYSPTASSLLENAPTEIVIRFSERVESSASSISVFSPSGQSLNLSPAFVDLKDSHIFHLPFASKENGSFLVSWQVVSADDGHFTKGAFMFSVGKQSQNFQQSETGFSIVHSSNFLEAATISLELFGQALLFGALIILAFVYRPLRSKFSIDSWEDYDFVFMKRLRKLIVFSIVFIFCGCLAYLTLKTLDLSTVTGTTFWASFWKFITTISAKYTVYRLVFSLLLSGIFFNIARALVLEKKISKPEWLMYFLILIISLLRAKVSHASASNFLPELSVLVNAIHLLFKDLWIGGIFAFLFLLNPIVKKASNLLWTDFFLSKLSQVLALALAGGGVTGAYIVWLHLKSLNNLLLTDWGVRFILLSIFAGFMFLARIFNQFYFQPKAFSKQNLKNKSSLYSLGFAIPFEMFMAVAVLVMTSQLIITTPPVTENFSFFRTTQSQGAELVLQEDPYEEKEFLLSVKDPNTKKMLDVKDVVVTLTNQDKGVGPVVAETLQRAPGSFVFNKNLLTPSGEWDINISVRRKNAYDATAIFKINYPTEILDSNLKKDNRYFDSLAAVSVFAGVVTLLLGYLFWHFAQKREKEVLPEEKIGFVSSFTLYQKQSWVLAAFILAISLHVLTGPVSGHSGYLKSEFQKLCEQKGDMWHNSVPMRSGKALASESHNGCMVGLGLGADHFVDFEEYKYFIRPAQASAFVKVLPKEPKTGEQTNIKISLKDLDGQPAQELSLDHDRILHTIIIHQDFSVFSHIHPEDFPELNKNWKEKSEFNLPYIFTKPGKYLIATDYMVRNKPFSESFYVNVSEENKSSGVILSPTASEGEESLKFKQQKNFEGLDVSLKLSNKEPKAKEKIDLLYTFKQNGREVKNLESYLSVPMHLAVVREDLFGFQHVHGWLPFSLWEKLSGQTIHAQHLSLPKNFGPEITTQIVFPTSGVYHIFGQVKHNGKVIDTHFVVKVK